MAYFFHDAGFEAIGALEIANISAHTEIAGQLFSFVEELLYMTPSTVHYLRITPSLIHVHKQSLQI